jgi:hypothetical protein
MTTTPSRLAPQVATPTLTRAVWFAEAEKRYGADAKKWRFRCPVCDITTSVQEWKDAGATEGAVAFSCIGRYLPTDPHKAFGKHKTKQPCDYAGGGLFRLNPIHVQDESGREHQVFDFADEPLCSSALAIAQGAAPAGGANPEEKP